jgi:hypothetical protein
LDEVAAQVNGVGTHPVILCQTRRGTSDRASRATARQADLTTFTLRPMTASRHMFLPRHILAFIVLGLIASNATRVTGSETDSISHIWTEYRDEQSFVRLSEYFDGKENPGKKILLRTQPESREGFYFSIRLNEPEGDRLFPGSVRLHLIAPDAEVPKTYDFALNPQDRKTSLILLGVTGGDWSYGDTLPLAWMIEILDQNGVQQAVKKSFLWENF